MTLVLHLKKLNSGAQVIPAPPKAVFQHILNSKVTPNLVQALVTVFVSHHGGSRDDSQLFWVKPAQLCNRLFRQTVRKVLLFGITGEILEGQHGQHDFFRSWRRRNAKALSGNIAAHNKDHSRRTYNEGQPKATVRLGACLLHFCQFGNFEECSLRTLVSISSRSFDGSLGGPNRRDTESRSPDGSFVGAF